MLNKPGKSLIQYMKVFAVTDHLKVQHNCMPGCESILKVTASWLFSVCGFC